MTNANSQPLIGQSPSGPHGTSGSGQPNQFDPWIIWVTFRRCWPWAVPIGAVLAGVVAFGVLQSFEPRYRASHLLEANDDFILFQGVMPTVDDLARSEKQFFVNPIVLDEVLDNAELRKAPSLSDPETAEANLRKNLSVGGGGSKKRMVVSYEDTDRVAAAEICNAVVASYLLRREEFDNARVNDLERWLGPEITNWETVVGEHQRRVQQLSKTTLGYAPGQRAALIEDDNHIALVTDLRKQITDLEVELALRNAERNRVIAMAKQEPSEEETPAEFIPPEFELSRVAPTETEIDLMVQQDPDVVEAKRMVERYKAALIDLEDSDLIRVRREYYQETQARRDQWVAKLETAEAEAKPKAEKTLNDLADEDLERRRQASEVQIANMKTQFEAQQVEMRLQKKRQRELFIAQEDAARGVLMDKLEVLREKYEDESGRLEKFGGASAELQFANDELQVASGVLVKLRGRVAAIRTERQKDGAVRTLAPATPPKSPIESVPLKKLAVMAGGTFFVPFLFGLLWEFKVQRVTDSSAVEKSTLSPVVGEVARLPSGASSTKGRRVFEESVDALRANLFLSTDTAHTRTIAVASSMSGEGKSSVASQLALSIAKATGETVLLVDADLRCPDQHEIFGLEMGQGLTGVLAGHVTLTEAVDSSLGELIHLLPAGRLHTSPHRLMSPSAMRDFYDDALQHYSYVVTDTAPVLSAGETLAISAAVDATLVCVMRDVSRMDSINKTTRRLEAAGANIAGTVFSGVTARQYAYRYGDYHYAVAGEPSEV